MKRKTARSVVAVMMVCGAVSVAGAAEQGSQPTKPRASSTGATAATASAAAVATPAATPASVAPSGSSQAAPASPLEGTTWPVRLTPDAIAMQKGEKPFDDTLIFKDGKVTMSACVKMGFVPSSYTAVPSGSSWLFTTRQMSSGQGTTQWVATFSGEAVKGSMMLEKTDGAVVRYHLEGKKAATPGTS